MSGKKKLTKTGFYFFASDIEASLDNVYDMPEWDKAYDVFKIDLKGSIDREVLTKTHSYWSEWGIPDDSI